MISYHWLQAINATKRHFNDVKLRYYVNHITPSCSNDDYTILCKFSGCIMSGYKVLEGVIEGPFPSISKEAQKRPVRIVLNIGHGILLLSQTADTNFSQVSHLHFKFS